MTVTPHDLELGDPRLTHLCTPSSWHTAGGQQMREGGKGGGGEKGSLLPTESGQQMDHSEGQVLYLFPLPDTLPSGGHTARGPNPFRPLLQCHLGTAFSQSPS